jgi:serine/threonine protein kinase
LCLKSRSKRQVLKKTVIRQKGQVEHTMSERSILCEVRHPFIVRLRFAFQNDKVCGLLYMRQHTLLTDPRGRR